MHEMKIELNVEFGLKEFPFYSGAFYRAATSFRSETIVYKT